VLTVWIVHGFTALRALMAGVNVVSREHIGQTWDSLVLTGVGVNKILLGKFGAALRTVLPWMVMLGVLRLAMLPLMSLALTKIHAHVMFRRFSYSSVDEYGAILVGWVGWAPLTGVVLAVALTVLEVVACVAVGVACSALARRQLLAAILAVSIRFAPVALFAAFIRQNMLGRPFWEYWTNSVVALADSGTGSLMQLGFPLLSWTRGEHELVLPNLIGSAALLGLFLVSAYGLAWLRIRRDGALREQRAMVRISFRNSRAEIS
jgi:hypothetical protein